MVQPMVRARRPNLHASRVRSQETPIFQVKTGIATLSIILSDYD